MKKTSLLCIIFLFLPNFIFAQTEVEYPALLRSIPPQEITEFAVSEQEAFFLYVSYLFEFLLIISILVVIGIAVLGGTLYLISSGDLSKKRSAKSWMVSALQGMVIISVSYLLLFTINHSLVLFQQKELMETDVLEAGQEYLEKDIMRMYFQIPLGLLIEDAVLNENAENKLNDVLDATNQAEGSSNDIEKGSKELLKIIESCPQGSPCCEKEMNSFLYMDQGGLLGLAQKVEKKITQEEERTKKEEDRIKKEKERLPTLSREEQEVLMSQLERDIKQVEEDKKELEEDAKYLNKIIKEAQEGTKKEETDESPLADHDRMAEENWEEQLERDREKLKEMREKEREEFEEEIESLSSMMPFQIDIDLSPEAQERAFEEAKERWDTKPEWQKNIEKGIQRTGDLFFYGALQDIFGREGIGSYSWDDVFADEIMFGNDYNWEPQTTGENILVGAGRITTVILGTAAISSTLPVKFFTFSTKAANLISKTIGASPKLAKIIQGGVNVFSREAVIDFLWIGGLQFLHSEGTTGEKLLIAGREGFISGVMAVGTRGLIRLGSPLVKRIKRTSDNLDIDMGTSRKTTSVPRNVKPEEMAQYHPGQWAEGVRRYGEHNYIPDIEKYIESQRGFPIRIVSLENMKTNKGIEHGLLFESLISNPRQIPGNANVIIYGHGHGYWGSKTDIWRAGDSNIPMKKVLQNNIGNEEIGLVITCNSNVPAFFKDAQGFLFYNSGRRITPVYGQELRGITGTRNIDIDIVFEKNIPQSARPINPEIEVDFLLPRLDLFFSINNNIFFANLFSVKYVEASSSWQTGGPRGPDDSPEAGVNWLWQIDKDGNPTGYYIREDGHIFREGMIDLEEIVDDKEIIDEREEPKEREEEEEEEDDEEEEEEATCPSCPNINPPVQAKISEIESYMSQLSSDLDELLLAKEPIKEDLYQLYKVIMLKSLGNRHVINYNSLLLERRRYDRESVIIDTDREILQIGSYFWDWTQWIGNILYQIEVNGKILEENDPVTFYLRMPENKQIIKNALELAQEAKKNDIQALGKYKKVEHVFSFNFFQKAIIFAEKIFKKDVRGVYAETKLEELDRCIREKNLDLSVVEINEIVEICGLAFDKTELQFRSLGDYLSCGMEIPAGETLELTWNHLMEVLDTVDKYEGEGRKLIEQQAKMNELSRQCNCPCQREMCPSFCGQCSLTCNLGAIKNAHQDVLETKEKMGEIADYIRLLTDGHFKALTEDICDSINEDIRDEEEKAICHKGGSKLITNHELITRKLNYSRFSFDECTTRPEHIEDALEGRRTGKVPVFGPLAEERDLQRYTKRQEKGTLVNTNDLNWFCCSQAK
jgi:hypothetical protein